MSIEGEALTALSDAPAADTGVTTEAPAAVTDAPASTPAAPVEKAPDPADRSSVIRDAFKRAEAGTLNEHRQNLRGRHAALQPRANGKFAGPPVTQPATQAAQGGPQAAAKPAAATAAPAQAAATAEPAQPAVTAKPLPNSWEAKYKADWEKLPLSIQEKIEKREAEAYNGLEQYKARAAFGREIENAIQPYAQTINQLGLKPAQAIGELMKADHILRYSNPQQKYQYLMHLAQTYRIPLTEEAMQQAVQQHGQQAPQQSSAELQALRQELQQLREQTENAPLYNEISRYESDRTNYPHFNVLRPVMAAIMNKAASEDKPMDIPTAYKEALWTLPEARDAALAEQRQALLNQNRQTVQASKSAAVQVRGAPGSALPSTIDPNDRRAVIANSLRSAGLNS